MEVVSKTEAQAWLCLLSDRNRLFWSEIVSATPPPPATLPHPVSSSQHPPMLALWVGNEVLRMYNMNHQHLWTVQDISNWNNFNYSITSIIARHAWYCMYSVQKSKCVPQSEGLFLFKKAISRISAKKDIRTNYSFLVACNVKFSVIVGNGKYIVRFKTAP
jgi:hypothetical protein